MKRKILSLVFAVFTVGAIFLMTACGGGNSTGGGSGTPSDGATGGSVTGSAN